MTAKADAEAIRIRPFADADEPAVLLRLLDACFGRMILDPPSGALPETGEMRKPLE